jgi:hypothetical protein
MILLGPRKWESVENAPGKENHDWCHNDEKDAYSLRAITGTQLFYDVIDVNFDGLIGLVPIR